MCERTPGLLSLDVKAQRHRRIVNGPSGLRSSPVRDESRTFSHTESGVLHLLRPLRIVLAVWVTVGSLNCFHPFVLVKLLDLAYSATLF